MRMLTVLAEHPPTFLDDHQAIADAIRIFIVFTGFTLALVSAKIGARAFRYADWERGFGTLAFALIVITPAVSGLYRFNEPLVLWTTITYLAGLSAGVVATIFRVTLRWRWWHDFLDRRLAARRRARRKR